MNLFHISVKDQENLSISRIYKLVVFIGAWSFPMMLLKANGKDIKLTQLLLEELKKKKEEKDAAVFMEIHVWINMFALIGTIDLQ